MDQSKPSTNLATANIWYKECWNLRCGREITGLPLACYECESVFYCGGHCRMRDLSDHQPYCKHMSTQGASSAHLDGLEYYQVIAAQEILARDLARDIGLSLPLEGPLK